MPLTLWSGSARGAWEDEVALYCRRGPEPARQQQAADARQVVREVLVPVLTEAGGLPTGWPGKPALHENGPRNLRVSVRHSHHLILVPTQRVPPRRNAHRCYHLGKVLHRAGIVHRPPQPGTSAP